MALSVNWETQVITVPRADMTIIQTVPFEIRELDVDAFRRELKDIEDGDGMPFLDTHRHNTTVSLGGVTLARVVEIINGYTVTFEDGSYAVSLAGANSNIADVTNLNAVQVRSANSAGLVVTGSALTTAQDTALTAAAADALLARQYAEGRYPIKIDEATSELIVYDTDGSTELRRIPVSDKDGNDITLAVGQQAERGVPVDAP